MELVGIEIQNFRSIGEEPVVINPMKKCNILIGKNNVGKSNVIWAFDRICKQFKKNDGLILDNYERFKLSKDNTCQITLIFQGNPSEEIVRVTKVNIFSFTFIEHVDRKHFVLEKTSLVNIEAHILLNIAENLTNSRIRSSAEIQNGFRNGQYGTSFFNEYCRPRLPKIEQIPQFRQIQNGDSYEFNGKNLIRELFQYQSPKREHYDLRDKFNKIQGFMQKLLHQPEAKLEIPHDGSEIIINNGFPLPLERYGTGVHELIILITAILSITEENTVCCIEEPEIHLHPSLQREFIEFITEETNIHYLISTHSPTLINIQNSTKPTTQADIQVFHLQLEDGKTIGGPVLENNHALLALNDLGVRASDILQSNCIIWVEGPSDRIYLNRWLELLKPELIEGLHYSIMFYGGRLLSHIGVSRDGKVPDELIDLLKVNQRAIVIMDSDKPNKRSRINSTKSRIREECDKTESVCWITEGREIENYIAPRIINQIYADTLKFPFIQDSYQRFEDSLDTCLKTPIKYADNKVKYARTFAENSTISDINGDLQKQLNKLIEKIMAWNK